MISSFVLHLAIGVPQVTSNHTTYAVGGFNVTYSLRQHGISYFLFFVFALCERKNEKQ
jgi:hypothetical protein